MSNKLMVARHTFDGTTTTHKFEFPYPASKFLVKNFSSGEIGVFFEEDALTDDSIIVIAPGMGQAVVINERGDGAGSPKSDFIMVVAEREGEVEVQELWY